jgi:hypothetical protein
MGIQEYAVRMTPREAASVDAKRVIEGLWHLGYRYLPTHPAEVEGAILVEPPRDEARLAEESRDYIIEAMVKTDEEGAQLKYLSLRFAVCQPDSVVLRFFDVVNHLALEYRLTISDGWREYEPGSSELLTAMQKEVRARKLRWSQIFDGNQEEHKVAVSEAWGLYQAKKSKQAVLAHR